MSLCPPARCGCTITSSSLSVQALAGGVGFNVEAYEGVATQAPDTRPGVGARFEGMRVWTSDTKRLWVWDSTVGYWRLLSEPRQSWVPVLTQGGAVTTSTTVAWFQRSMGIWEGMTRLEISSAGSPGQFLAITYPQTLVNLYDSHGGFWYFDAGTTVYTGEIIESTTAVGQFQVTSNASRFGSLPAVTTAANDVVKVWMTGTYNEASI